MNRDYFCAELGVQNASWSRRKWFPIWNHFHLICHFVVGRRAVSERLRLETGETNGSFLYRAACVAGQGGLFDGEKIYKKPQIYAKLAFFPWVLDCCMAYSPSYKGGQDRKMHMTGCLHTANNRRWGGNKPAHANDEMPRAGTGKNNTNIILCPLLTIYIFISHSLNLLTTYYVGGIVQGLTLLTPYGNLE